MEGFQSPADPRSCPHGLIRWQEGVSLSYVQSPLFCDHAFQASRAEKKMSPRPLEHRPSASVHTRTLQVRRKCTNTCRLWPSYVQPRAHTPPFSRDGPGYLVDQLEDVVRNEEAAGGVLHQVEGLREVHGVLIVVDLCGTRERSLVIVLFRSPRGLWVRSSSSRAHPAAARLPGAPIVDVPEADR